MKPRLRCPICVSRRWRKDPTSGLIVCSEGHVFENYRNETTERDEPPSHALRKRAIRARKPVDEGLSNPNPSHYYGERADFHYLACLQVLLRKQVAAATELWSLPPEFEAISRDVWSLALTLKGAIPHIDSGNGEQEKGEKEPMTANSDEDDSEGDKSDSEGSESENGDTGVANLLDRLSEDDDFDAENSPNETQPIMRFREEGVVSRFPYYISVAVLLVSCWVLRLPVIYSDILNLIAQYHLPYMDPIPRGILPEAMTMHLNSHIARSLSPKRPPKAHAVHKITRRLTGHLKRVYCVDIPPMNVGPLLWRLTHSVGAPLTFYRATKRLCGILDVDFKLQQDASKPLEQRLSKGSVVPEVTLAALAAIMLHMVDEDHGENRTPWDHTDPLYEFQAASATVSRLGNNVGPLLHSDILSAAPERLDELLDNCGTALLGDEVTRHDRYDTTFPLHLESLTPFQKGSIMEKCRAENQIRHSDADGVEKEGVVVHGGEGYAIYSSQDIRGEVGETYGRVLDAVAAWCGGGGVTREEVLRVTEAFERRLVWDLERGATRHLMTDDELRVTRGGPQSI